MSDNTSDTPTGVDDGLGEPSMEDILASIRRIIAEDDGTDNSHIDVMQGLSSVTNFNATSDETIEESIDEIDLDDLLVLDDTVVDDILVEMPDDIELAEMDLDEEADFNPVSNVMSDLEDKLALNTEKAAPVSHEAEIDVFDAVDLVLPEPVLDDGLDEALFLDEKFEIEIEEVDPIVDFDDVIPEFSDENNVVSAELDDSESQFSDDSDLDLVKSLMAELTDTSFMDDGESLEIADSNSDLSTDIVDSSDDVLDENFDLSTGGDAETDIDALLADIESIETGNDNVDADDLERLESLLPDTPDQNVLSDDALEQDQILNDILDMAIEDEETHNALELSVDEEEYQSNDHSESDVTSNSLLQIAKQAEADAEQMDGAEFALDPEQDIESTEEILNELDLVLSEVVDEETGDSVEDDETADLIEEIELEMTETAEDEAETVDLFIDDEQETEDMAKTARKDAILDEVTETATAGAFASLSQAVEENAVFTESGPRIGELVQEALRPMLKEWLDANLKSIVERAVAKEVKRIASGK